MTEGTSCWKVAHQMNHSRTVVQRKWDENKSRIFPRSSCLIETDVKTAEHMQKKKYITGSFTVMLCRALTCLAVISFPSGMGAPFSVAMRFSVARAFSWFPVSTSYRALSGSHCRTTSQTAVTQLQVIQNISRQIKKKKHTHKTQDGKDKEGNGGEAEQPTPAQSWHHQDR